jgi:hypothetical protein
MISLPAWTFFQHDYRLTEFIGAVAVHAQGNMEPFVPLFVDLVLCRAVDNFARYVDEILTLIYKTTPGGRKPRKLFHLGLLEQHEYVRAHLNFPVLPNETQLQRISRIIETRNLFIHNRGLISERFLQRVPGFQGTLGQELHLDLDDVAQDLSFVQHLVRDVDFRVGKQFKVVRQFPLCNSVAE